MKVMIKEKASHRVDLDVRKNMKDNMKVMIQ